MSCFPEYRYAIYVDGELEGAALREVQAHLIGCRRCRALVVALEEEATLLGDLLHDRVVGELVTRGKVEAQRKLVAVFVVIRPAAGFDFNAVFWQLSGQHRFSAVIAATGTGGNTHARCSSRSNSCTIRRHSSIRLSAGKTYRRTE